MLKMRRQSHMGLRSLLQTIFIVSAFLLPFTSALKFDLVPVAHSGKDQRCIRNFVARDQLVIVTAIVSGKKGDGQVVNMHVR